MTISGPPWQLDDVVRADTGTGTRWHRLTEAGDDDPEPWLRKTPREDISGATVNEWVGDRGLPAVVVLVERVDRTLDTDERAILLVLSTATYPVPPMTLVAALNPHLRGARDAGEVQAWVGRNRALEAALARLRDTGLVGGDPRRLTVTAAGRDALKAAGSATAAVGGEG